MRDPRYAYTASGFAYRRDAADWVLLGVLTVMAPLWVPFWILGHLMVLLAMPFSRREP